MHCKYCDTSFRPSKYTKNKNACPDCDGITDDLDIEDEEFRVDAWCLRNPTGKTQPVFDKELELD